MGVKSTHYEQGQQPAQLGTPPWYRALRILIALAVFATAVVAPLIWFATSINADSNKSYRTSSPLIFAPTEQPTPTVLTSAWIWCVDCGEEGMPVNVWQMAGKNRGHLVTRAPHGTQVTPAQQIQGDDGRTWYYISLSGRSGYVSSSFLVFREPNPKAQSTSMPTTTPGNPSADLVALTSTSEPIITVAAATADAATLIPSPALAVMAQVKVHSLNVRNGPGTNYDIFTTIKANERYAILALSPHKLWAKLDVAGTEGWAYTEYLSLEHGVVPVDGSLVEHEVPTTMPIPTVTAISHVVNTVTAMLTP